MANEKPIEIAGQFSDVGLFNPEGQPQFQFGRDRRGTATFLDELAASEAQAGGAPMHSRLMNNSAFTGMTPEQMEQLVRANEAQQINTALQGSNQLSRAHEGSAQVQTQELARRLQAMQGKGNIESQLVQILSRLQPKSSDGVKASDISRLMESGALSVNEARARLGYPPINQ
jgi:hypothetical protein